MALWFVLSPGVSGALPGVARTDSHPDQRRQRMGEPHGHQLLAEAVWLPKLRDDHRGSLHWVSVFPFSLDQSCDRITACWPSPARIASWRYRNIFVKI